MTSTIKINGIYIYAYHGCLPEETKIGGEYIVDVEMLTNVDTSYKSDDLKDTIDYCTIYEIVKKEMAIPSKLIEHVCKRLFDSIKNQFKTIEKIKVCVTKIKPPMNGNVDKVLFELEG